MTLNPTLLLIYLHTYPSDHTYVGTGIISSITKKYHPFLERYLGDTFSALRSPIGSFVNISPSAGDGRRCLLLAPSSSPTMAADELLAIDPPTKGMVIPTTRRWPGCFEDLVDIIGRRGLGERSGFGVVKRADLTSSNLAEKAQIRRQVGSSRRLSLAADVAPTLRILCKGSKE